MKAYFRQLKITQIIGLLNLFFLAIIIIFLVFAFSSWYGSLPEGSSVRTRFKLGKFLTHFEIGHLFYDWRKLGIPIYDLQVRDKKLNAVLEDLPKDDSLMTYEYKNFVKAQFFSDGQLYNVKVRIRGLSPNHWIDEKKSWRINFNKEKLFNHKKSVNLIIPQDRGYFAEYLSNHVARKLGLLVPEDKFAFFRINGVLQGIYYEIEQPNGSFLEFHGKVDKANLYRENSWDWHKYGFPEIFSDVGHWKKQSSEEVSGFENYADLDYLISLLQNKDKKRFYREIPALLNMDNFLTWQAHSMIFGSYHQSGKANMLIYSNIIDGRFELIPFDVNLFAFDGTFIDKPYNPLVDRILSDSEYLHRRNMILWEYVKNENSLIDDLKFYDSAHKKYRNGFYADRNKGFTNAHFEQEVKGLRGTFLKNRKKIIANLKFSSVLAGTHLFCNDPSVLASIDMASQGFSALELSAIKFSVTENEKASDYDHLGLYYDSNGSGSFENSDRLLANFSIDVSGKSLNSNNFSFLLYPGRNEDLKPAKKYYRFFIASEDRILKKAAIKLAFTSNNAVTKEPATIQHNYIDDRTFADFPRISDSRESFLLSNPIFRKGESAGESVILPSGEYIIEKNIIVPAGINLVIQPQVTLKFAKGISFISYGRVIAIGTNPAPILLTAADNKEPWGNFAVVGHGADNSKFKNAIFEYAGESFLNGIYFTGALAIHSANAKVSECIFRYNQGDDGINVKSGRLSVEGSVFYKNHSDAVDYDFSEGQVKNSYFYDNSGDALDLCATVMDIEGSRIERSGDKGISVGEASKPKIINNLIRSCNIGIASKDSSLPQVLNNTIIDNNSGIEVYIKKQVFGGAGCIVKNSVLWDNKKQFTIDENSSLDIEDSIVEGGYKGKNIYTSEPKFLDAKAGDFRLMSTVADGAEEKITLGILSNPEILPISGFISQKNQD